MLIANVLLRDWKLCECKLNDDITYKSSEAYGNWAWPSPPSITTSTVWVPYKIQLIRRFDTT
jgi:hypothetical protein